MSSETQRFSVIPLLLASGERLPCLVETSTWIPARAANRWAIRYRRNRVQSSTLSANLRVLGKLYSWARLVARIDLDDFLCSGHRLNVRQLESFALYLREPQNESHDYLDSGSYDNALSVAEDFLKWCLDGSNRGGCNVLTFEKLALERSRIELLFEQLRIGAAKSSRIEPLDENQVDQIRQAIGPILIDQRWTFPKVFSPETRLRNWLMFETALDLGLRRGEILKLKTSSVPRGSDTGVRVIRYPDDSEDTRTIEPSVKTAERVVPASRDLLRSINLYLTSPPPIGRVFGTSSYLFVTRTGAPVSIDRANDIIESIAGYSDVKFSWHSLRHTWAERLAESLCKEPNGLDHLQWLGGWTNPESPKRYIQNAIAKHAFERLAQLRNESLERSKAASSAS